MKYVNKVLIASLVASSLLTFSPASFSSTKTATNKATASINTACSLTMGNLDFGNIVPGQVSSTTTNTLNVTCSNSLAYTFNTVHPTDGTDCPNLVGAIKGNKLYYLMSYQTTYLANVPGHKISSVGTGIQQSYTIKGTINPVSTGSGLNCEAPQNNPTANNINPYVAPDNYATTANMVITF